MLRIKEKYKAGFKHKGVQYYPEEYSQEKLERLYNGPLKDFIEEVEIEEVEIEEVEEVKEVKPKQSKKKDI